MNTFLLTLSTQNNLTYSQKKGGAFINNLFSYIYKIFSRTIS